MKHMDGCFYAELLPAKERTEDAYLVAASLQLNTEEKTVTASRNSDQEQECPYEL